MDPRYKPKKSMPGKVGREYLKAQVQTADRLSLMLMTYDAVIKAAQNENARQVKRAVSLLINSLDMDHATEFGLGLLKSYKYAQYSADKGDFKAVLHVFVQLKEAWSVLKASQVRKEES